MIQKLIKVKKILNQFGIIFCLKYCFYKFCKKDNNYIELICEYLKNFERNIINKYNSEVYEDNKRIISNKIPIWVCWFQGENNMPELCKVCYNRLKKMAPNNAEIHLITLENYKEYIDLPEYIIKKFNDGIISYTHFSDIIRWMLLEKWGGFWIDSTVYCTKEIEKEFLLKNEFWSIKLDEIYDYNCIGQVISKCKWSSFILKDTSNSLLVKFILEATLLYWKDHDIIIDYFMQNLLIKIAYENIPKIKEEIDIIPKSNDNIYDLHLIMDNKYEEDKYNYLIDNTSFMKLTWKKKYRKITEDKKDTFYGHILKLEDME